MDGCVGLARHKIDHKRFTYPVAVPRCHCIRIVSHWAVAGIVKGSELLPHEKKKLCFIQSEVVAEYATGRTLMAASPNQYFMMNNSHGSNAINRFQLRRRAFLVGWKW